MKIAYVIIGVIVLLILFGVFFAFMKPGVNGPVAVNNPYGVNAYPANLTSTASPCSPCSNTTAYQLSPYPVYTAVPAQTANYTACPTVAYNTGAASMWYTSPTYAQSGMYTYYYGTPASTQNYVYPGATYQVYPGSSQTYQYSYPGSAGGYYSGGYSYTYPQQQPVYQQQQVQMGASASGGTTWYR